jgi:hypothetical protein
MQSARLSDPAGFVFRYAVTKHPTGDRRSNVTNSSGKGRVKRTNSQAAERHAVTIRRLWAEEQQRQARQLLELQTTVLAALSAPESRQQEAQHAALDEQRDEDRSHQGPAWAGGLADR